MTKSETLITYFGITHRVIHRRQTYSSISKQAITSNDIFDSFRNPGQQLPEAFTVVSTSLFDRLSTSTYGLTFKLLPTRLTVSSSASLSRLRLLQVEDATLILKGK
jgi:hypothetical protein